MSTTSLPTRVAEAKAILEEIPAEHDDLRTEQLVDLHEALEFLDRLETCLCDEHADD